MRICLSSRKALPLLIHQGVAIVPDQLPDLILEFWRRGLDVRKEVSEAAGFLNKVCASRGIVLPRRGDDERQENSINRSQCAEDGAGHIMIVAEKPVGNQPAREKKSEIRKGNRAEDADHPQQKRRDKEDEKLFRRKGCN